MKLVVIAGPQSSGKTTSLNHIKHKYRSDLDFHPEINQYNLYPKTTKLGSISVSSEMEQEIIRADLSHINNISPTSRIQVLETSVFHLVYSNHLAPSIYQEAKMGYLKAISSHELYVIFIDSKPEISFARRKQNYLARVKDKPNKKELMAKYEQRINDLYPIWHQVYNEIDYAKDKTIIRNNHSDQDRFLREVEAAFTKVLY